ncbi:MAG: hypothetical protein EOP07_01995 [Proteobacteria bacterium]|nr:MAG: hypothetical protein EOP07_01995 [Pseudomonadota bacterium]
MKRSTGLIAAFSLIGLNACKTTSNQSDVKFGAGEHMTLGNRGYEQACRGSNICLPNIPRADKKISFSYGELVAFAGDFYGTPEEMDNDKDNASFWTFLFQKDIKATKKLFADEAEDIKKQIETGKAIDDNGNTVYRDNNTWFTYNFGYQYVELATNNVDHFGWHNMKKYVAEHDKALEFAVRAYQESDGRKKEELLRKALFTNAFADHFLTDGFASGHVRTPRAEAIRWATQKGLNKEAIGALAKVIHDNDHTLENHGGLKVINSKGNAWKTRADGELFVIPEADKNPVYVALPTEAVRISIEEVLEAYRTGATPEGVYKATELAPFIDPSEDKLIDSFPANRSNKEINSLMVTIGPMWTYGTAIGLSYDLTRQYFKELPEMMKNFREGVKKDVDEGLRIYVDPKAKNLVEKKTIDLKARLPEKYLKGYMNVQ